MAVNYPNRPYIPEPYRSPYTRTIGELLGLSGQRAAEMELARGDASARMWASVGDTIGRSVQGFQQSREQQRERARQATLDTRRTEADQITLDNARVQNRALKREEGEQAFNRSMLPLARKEQGGIVTWDRDLLTKEYTGAGMGHLLPDVFKELDAADAAHTTALQARREAAAGDALRLMRGGVQPQSYQAMLEYWRANDALPTREIESLARVGDDPKAIEKALMAVVSASPKHAALVQPKLGTAAPGSVVYDERTGDKVLEVAAKPKEAPAVGSFEDYVVSRYGPRPTAQQIEQARKAYNQADDRAITQDVTQLTPAGIDMAALNYKKSGTMPALGMGDRTTRQRIINRAAELTAEDEARIAAGGNDLATRRADYGADSGSLRQLQKQRDAITAFEKTATRNIDVFLKTAEKVVDTGSPLANTLVRQATGKLLGSPDQAAYDAARQVAINEIAKITSNPNLSGTLSDSARHEVEAFNPQNATLAQSVAVMKLLKQDMANRTQALDEQITTIRGRLGSGNSAGAPAPARTIQMQAPDGRTLSVPADKVEEAKRRGAKVIG